MSSSVWECRQRCVYCKRLMDLIKGRTSPRERSCTIYNIYSNALQCSMQAVGKKGVVFPSRVVRWLSAWNLRIEGRWIGGTLQEENKGPAGHWIGWLTGALELTAFRFRFFASECAPCSPQVLSQRQTVFPLRLSSPPPLLMAGPLDTVQIYTAFCLVQFSGTCYANQTSAGSSGSISSQVRHAEESIMSMSKERRRRTTTSRRPRLVPVAASVVFWAQDRWPTNSDESACLVTYPGG